VSSPHRLAQKLQPQKIVEVLRPSLWSRKFPKRLPTTPERIARETKEKAQRLKDFTNYMVEAKLANREKRLDDAIKHYNAALQLSPATRTPAWD